MSSKDGSKLVADLGEDNVAFVQYNVLARSDQVNLFKTAVNRSPTRSIDVVIANAGISGEDTLWRGDDVGPNDDPIEPDLKILRTNLLGLIYAAKLAIHFFSRNRLPGATLFAAIRLFKVGSARSDALFAAHDAWHGYAY
ncbi:hypothetical protein LTR37_003655 [Vermiconidia calcicola]|uniref:Uncharacterized protein n=1 Tax=Vermiconidia calcicola TaxID=1690605 RepID=A0ACC3NPM0_9PEZI|nr:hypothetical protein LTR37_003655 [Vermiconidia calcicola]